MSFHRVVGPFRAGACFVCHLTVSGWLLFSTISLRADDWPQWLGPQRDAVWRETGIVEKFEPGAPKFRWRVPIGGGYSGPAVFKGRVYVMDRLLAKGSSNPSDPFQRGEIAGT